MQAFQQRQRATILVHTGNVNEAQIKAQQEACLQYCQKHGYQLPEQNIYLNEGQSLFSNAPQLINLRMLVVQHQLDVIVIASPSNLGTLLLWKSLPLVRTIDEFYKQQVRIESATQRHGAHDIHQQMLLDGIYLMKLLNARRQNS